MLQLQFDPAVRLRRDGNYHALVPGMEYGGNTNCEFSKSAFRRIPGKGD